MATIIVKDTTGLTTALKSAQAGDTIKLAAGDYSAFSLNGVKFGGAGVTITSLDPAKEASLNGFELRGCEGLNFQALELKVAQAQVNPYQVIESSRIALNNVNVHGSLDGDAQNDGGGILIRLSRDVTVTNSEFHQLEYGIAHVDSKGVTINANKFTEIQEDGVRGGGTSNIKVTNNTFSNFDPVDGDHPDAIQFWTKGTLAQATDITVSGNLILRGEGAATQGIFFRDQVGTMPFKNVLVQDNMIVGTMANGVMVNGGDGVKILNNTVVALPGQTAGIGLTKATNIQLTGNQASQYSFDSTVTNMSNTSSTTLSAVTDGGAALVKAYIALHPQLLALSTTTELQSLVSKSLAMIEATRIQSAVVTGTAGNDQLKTLADRNTRLEGGDGNDLLDSVGVGHNTLVGGAGDDTYRLTSLNDVVIENANGGSDQVISSVNVTLSENIEKLSMIGDARVGVGNALGNSIGGSSGGDTISGMGGDDNIQSNDGDDRVFGGEGADSVYGGNGADTIAGDAGADRLRGDGGNDSLSGGAGNDTLDGSLGQDVMAGGLGADQFTYNNLEASGEVIFDFSRAEGDKVILTALDANTVADGNQAFAFIGTAAFSKVAGQLRYEVKGADSYVMGDLNGDGVADFRLLMKNVTSFQATDFML